MAGDSANSPEWRARAAAWLDTASPAVPLPGQVVHEVFQHVRECYPEEACGLLVGPPGGVPSEVERCTNVQTRRKLAGESELDARHGYWIDERELIQVLRRAEGEGHAILWIYHSHVDTEAYFSHTDLAAALGPEGTPLWPGVGQLVLACYEDGVRDAACFVWDDDEGCYSGRVVQQVK